MVIENSTNSHAGSVRVGDEVSVRETSLNSDQFDPKMTSLADSQLVRYIRERASWLRSSQRITNTRYLKLK
jgi:hypothetical protein